MYYGYESIPAQWRAQIARAEYITSLCTTFYNSLTKIGFEKIRVYIPYFEATDTENSCHWREGRLTENGTYTMPYPVYEDKLLQFIDDVSNSGLMDYAYGATIQKYGLEMNDGLAGQIDTADLKLTKAILTCYIRQERFYEGLWTTAVKEGIFLALLKRLRTLLSNTG